MKPPLTSLHDALLLVVGCALAVVVVHFIRFAIGFEVEARGIVRRANAWDRKSRLDIESVTAAAWNFHRTLFAFVCSITPAVAWALGWIACSMLRDHGYKIFPGPAVGVALFTGAAAWISIKWRQDRIRALAGQSLKTEPSNQVQPTSFSAEG